MNLKLVATSRWCEVNHTTNIFLFATWAKQPSFKCKPDIEIIHGSFNFFVKFHFGLILVVDVENGLLVLFKKGKFVKLSFELF